ncbi:hypothetical protein JOF53_004106 [Crossiella equi]|uniref:Uncharacterized protein n=1 Tax=Crossiella equi TaxID=130796 RepID=A0ABS5AF72_9PSEU|nr:hypothetical protein [Crossiella equi]MBP2475234.1 hypothetical protein [Crossiella equi]
MTDPNAPKLPPLVADAGTGIGIVRVLPGSVQTNAPGLTDEDEKKLPKQAVGELGLGLASAQVNSQAFLTFERAIAESSPFGFAVNGRAPRVPGGLSQMAVPDNARPTTGGLTPPASPLDALLKVGALQGSVHARWDEKLGPCVEPVADARTSLASLSAVNVIPTLPGTAELGKVLPGKDIKLDGPLSQLGGLLSGEKSANGAGALLRLPDLFSARSTVRLIDVPGVKGKAVQATSTLQVASIQLLAGTPAEVRIDVVSQPKLTAISTGDAKTSSVKYEAPVLRVSQGGKELGKLDAANPKLDVPIPVLGGALNLGVLRLSTAQVNEKRDGSAVGAVARLFDLALLPTDALKLPGLPSSLVQISLGEQVVRAAAPAGGYPCTPVAAPTSTAPAPGAPAPQGAVPPLAYTNGAYQTVPLLWAGFILLLSGVVIVAALPDRRRYQR